MRPMTSGENPGPSSSITIRGALVPSGDDAHLRGGEIDGVLDQIAEPVENCRDCAGRPARRPSPFFTMLILTPKSRCGADDFLDHEIERHLIENVAGSSSPREVSLPRMLRQRATCWTRRPNRRRERRRELFAQLLRVDDADGGERRAEFMRRRRGEAVELGQMLFAREDEFGRRQSVGELARLLGNTRG